MPLRKPETPTFFAQRQANFLKSIRAMKLIQPGIRPIKRDRHVNPQSALDRSWVLVGGSVIVAVYRPSDEYTFDNSPTVAIRLTWRR